MQGQGTTVLDDDPGPVCALGSEAERMVMVPERTVMAVYRRMDLMRLERLEPRPSKGSFRCSGKGRTRQLSA